MKMTNNIKRTMTIAIAAAMITATAMLQVAVVTIVMQ